MRFTQLIVMALLMAAGQAWGQQTTLDTFLTQTGEGFDLVKDKFYVWDKDDTSADPNGRAKGMLGTETLIALRLTTSAGMRTNLIDETGLGAAVFQQTPTFLTHLWTPMVIGGTAATSDLVLQTTTGVGATGADMHFRVGNNGALQAMTILNNGDVIIPGNLTISGVLTADVVEEAVGLGDITPINTGTVLGRYSVGPGPAQEITITGGEFKVDGGVLTLTTPAQPLDPELSAIANLPLLQNQIYIRRDPGSGPVTHTMKIGPDFNLSTGTMTLTVTPQPQNTHLDDLADGSLTGSKVGPGIDASNIIGGTLPNARLDPELQAIANISLHQNQIYARTAPSTGPVDTALQINSGHFGTADNMLSIALVPGNLVTGGINAANITTGILPPARLNLTKTQLNTAVTDGDPAYVGADNVYTGANLFNGFTVFDNEVTVNQALTTGGNLAVNSPNASTIGGGAISTPGGLYVGKNVIVDSDVAPVDTQTGGFVVNGSSAGTSVAMGGGKMFAGHSVHVGTGGGTSHIISDGSATFAGGEFAINSDGAINVGTGSAIIDADGNTTLGGTLGVGGYIDYKQAVAPAAPAAGKTRVYGKTDGLIYQKTPAGVETVLTGAGGGSGGLTDTDYGDVVVSGGGTAMTIDTGVVTLPKMASMAASKLLGRHTSAGSPQEIGLSADFTLSGGSPGTLQLVNIYQPLNTHLTDLSDGTLTGSKVGTGINASNITTGTIQTEALPTAVTLLGQTIPYSAMPDLGPNQLVGRGAGTGDPQAINIGSGLSITGTTLDLAAGGGGGSDFGTTLATDDTSQGTVRSGFTNSGGVTQWDAVYLTAGSAWALADADGAGTYPCRGLATATAANGAATTVVTGGTIRNDAWTWTAGGTVYLSATAGGLTQTAPAVTGAKIQVIGYALNADTLAVEISADYGTAP